MFCERKYSAKEMEEYVTEALTRPWDRPKLEHNERGRWGFSPKKMYDWCDRNNILVMPNPDTPELTFINRLHGSDNKAYWDLVQEFYKYAN